MNGFQTHHGLQAFISRLDHEVNICRKEQPFVIRTNASAAAVVPSGEGGGGVVGEGGGGTGASSTSMMDTTSEDAPKEDGDQTMMTSTNMTIDDDVEPGKEYLTGECELGGGGKREFGRGTNHDDGEQTMSWGEGGKGNLDGEQTVMTSTNMTIDYDGELGEEYLTAW